MGLFGKKKKAEQAEEEAKVNEAEDTEEEDTAEGEPEEEISDEERFKRATAELSNRVRFMFPHQMLVGFFYAELQADGYIDDFCCYVTNGELIERDDIPSKCGMSYVDMVSREEKLEQAFFLFRKAAEAYSKRPCNGVSVMLSANGQVKLEIVSSELVEGEEDERYAKFRDKVAKGDPKYLPPQLSKEEAQAIQEKTAPVYRELGSEFFSFLPETEFRRAYFYTEVGNGGIFMYHRMVLEDGTILDGDDLYERFDMNKEEAEKARMEIVRHIMEIRNIIIQAENKPFTTITLTINAKGEFQSFMGFGPVDPENEERRLEEWKANFNGEESMQRYAATAAAQAEADKSAE